MSVNCYVEHTVYMYVHICTYEYCYVEYTVHRSAHVSRTQCVDLSRTEVGGGGFLSWLKTSGYTRWMNILPFFSSTFTLVPENCVS